MSMRSAVVAGQFYPDETDVLRHMVEEYMAHSRVTPEPERVVGVVVPHAGYIYSGQTAGFAYARIRGKKPKRAILLGGSHRYPIEHASVFDAGGFESPLGSFPVDEGFAKTLAAKTDSTTIRPHMYEHSLEVQLPFLWVALGPVPIVPVLFGGPPSGWHVNVGRMLAEMVDDQDLVIASTDLSHYLPDDAAHETDKRTVDTVLGKDSTALIDGLARERCSMCGAAAVVAAMAFASARGATAWSLLDYRTSAQSSGDYTRVVGYAAISMERES